MEKRLSGIPMVLKNSPRYTDMGDEKVPPQNGIQTDKEKSGFFTKRINNMVSEQFGTKMGKKG